MLAYLIEFYGLALNRRGRTRLRAVSYVSLHVKPKHASGEAASRDKRGRLVSIPYCNITSWFVIALPEIRTRRTLREKADCKPSKVGQTPGSSPALTGHWRKSILRSSVSVFQPHTGTT